MLTQEERETLYRAEKTVLGDTLIWQPGQGSWKLAAPVFLGTGEELILYGVKSPRRFGFALRTRRKELIRRWDFKRHTNPDGEVFTGPHKHYWTPEFGEEMAYTVDDVPTGDFNEALLAFLAECNIQIDGPYSIRFLG